MGKFKQIFYEQADPFEVLEKLPSNDSQKIIKIMVDLDDDRNNKKLQSELTKLLKKHNLKWEWSKNKSGIYIPIKIMEL